VARKVRTSGVDRVARSAFPYLGGSTRSARVIRAEDRPSDLCLPLGRVRCAVGIAQAVIAHRPVDADLMACRVGAELAVGEVDIGQRAVVGDDGQLRGGHDYSDDAPDRPDRALDRDGRRRLAAIVLEQLAGDSPPLGPVCRRPSVTTSSSA